MNDCSNGMLESPLRKDGLPQTLFHLWASAQGSTLQVFLSHSQEGLGHVYISWFAPLAKFYLLITKYTGGKIPLVSLGVKCWIPQLPNRHFCLWMGV